MGSEHQYHVLFYICDVIQSLPLSTDTVLCKSICFIPHCPGWGGSPPRFESPRRSSAVRWAACCQQHLQIHRGGGQRQPWCGHNVSEEAEGSLGVSVQSGCVSTWEDGRSNESSYLSRRRGESSAQANILTCGPWTQTGRGCWWSLLRSGQKTQTSCPCIQLRGSCSKMEESHRSDRSDGHKGRDPGVNTSYSQCSSG